jgi:hypothetical protein
MRNIARTSMCSVLLTLLAVTTARAGAGFASDPAVNAVRHRDCSRAIREVNAVAVNPDAAHAFTLFIGGRMLDEGICARKAPDEAAKYLARSAQLGATEANLELAAVIGMGQSVPQDYVSAGHVCHDGGVDPSGLLPFYSVGYACTVSGVASRLLRTSLPKGAFRLPTQSAIVEFNPVNSELRIVSTPEPQRGAPPLGSIIGPLLVDPAQLISKAFHDALTSVPKPDAKNLSDQPIRLVLDLDIALEGGVPLPSPPSATLLPGDHLPYSGAMH